MQDGIMHEAPKGGGAPAPATAPELPRRALPSPFDSPPFPGSEYQGYPLIGVPPDNTMWPLMQAIQGTAYNDLLNASKTRVYGWVTAEANWSTSRHSNTPDSYWIRPNKADLDQALLRVERQPDTVHAELVADADLRLSAPPAQATTQAPDQPPPTLRLPHDDRRPRPGTILTRRYKGRMLQVEVLEHGCAFAGQTYRSLSAVAKAVTGSHCSGHFFFGLTEKGAKPDQLFYIDQ
jgi:hypothetical protein